jgi:hypothetical protein
MSHLPDPNVRVTANVMVVPDPPDSTLEIRSLPGDLAVQIYRQLLWPDTWSIKKALSEVQWQEYEQYLVCRRCGRPCAGTCSA